METIRGLIATLGLCHIRKTQSLKNKQEGPLTRNKLRKSATLETSDTFGSGIWGNDDPIFKEAFLRSQGYIFREDYHYVKGGYLRRKGIVEEDVEDYEQTAMEDVDFLKKIGGRIMKKQRSFKRNMFRFRKLDGFVVDFGTDLRQGCQSGSVNKDEILNKKMKFLDSKFDKSEDTSSQETDDVQDSPKAIESKNGQSSLKSNHKVKDQIVLSKEWREFRRILDLNNLIPQESKNGQFNEKRIQFKNARTTSSLGVQPISRSRRISSEASALNLATTRKSYYKTLGQQDDPLFTFSVSFYDYMISKQGL